MSYRRVPKLCMGFKKIKVTNFQFECDQCSYMAKRNFYLSRHIMNKHSDPSKNESSVDKKICPQCMQIFQSSIKGDRHIRIIHERIDRINCKNV